MDFLLEKLWNYVARDKSLTFQVRLFRLMCLTTTMLCLLVICPINLFLPNIPFVVNVANIFLGLFALFCYVQSQRGRNLMKLFLALLILSLNPVWFLNGGMNGSITYYFFPVLMLPMVFFRGRTRWIISGLIMANVCALLFADYKFPGLVIPFHDRHDQMLDLTSGIICSFIAITVVFWVIVTNYDWEQSLIARYAKDLAASEENYRGVVENAMSIILRLDAEGKIIFFNQFAENLFGYQRAEIIGRHLVGSIVPEVSSKGENLAAKIAELLRQPEQFKASENENICRDGRRLWVNWTNQPIYDDQGRLREILCVGAEGQEQQDQMLGRSQFDALAVDLDLGPSGLDRQTQRCGGKLPDVLAATLDQAREGAGFAPELALEKIAQGHERDIRQVHARLAGRVRHAGTVGNSPTGLPRKPEFAQRVEGLVDQHMGEPIRFAPGQRQAGVEQRAHGLAPAGQRGDQAEIWVLHNPAHLLQQEVGRRLVVGRGANVGQFTGKVARVGGGKDADIVWGAAEAQSARQIESLRFEGGSERLPGGESAKPRGRPE